MKSFYKGYNVEIVKLDPSQKKKAIDVLWSAFFDYPEFKYYFPDHNRRKFCLPWYLGRVLATAQQYGEAYTTPTISGVALVLLPGHTRISQWEYIRCGFLPAPFILGIRDFIRSQAGEEFIGDLHEEIMRGCPHYYLWALAVDPAEKRQGIGTTLLEPILATADANEKPVYLETHDEKNVAYYQRFGFHLAKKACLPKSEVHVWGMLREPA